MKPLGHKSYGHIPHFIGSRMTPADKHCEAGHQRIMTQKTRDRHDLIIVQEKLDGSNCTVAKINKEIIPLTRSGYHANTSPYEQHHEFANWVMQNYKRFDEALDDGQRIIGEWMIEAHGTRYNLPHEPFVAFDVMVEHDRFVYHDFLLKVLPFNFIVPRLIHIGQAYKLDSAKEAIRISGHGAIDPVEGFVYRCERNKKVDFLCKWVRSDKIDGCYLDKGIKNTYTH